MKVLIAEDDPNILKGLVEILSSEGYTTVTASTGTEAIEKAHYEHPDFACLDIMMPGIDGYVVCKRLRKDFPDLPIIFISAKSEEFDKVVGLELGADDFITKPFGVKEVVARIRAVTRRCISRKSQEAAPDNTFQMNDLTVIPDELRAKRGEYTIELSLREIKLLRLLHKNAGKVLSRDMIFEECWGIDYLPNSRTLDQHISQLRKKIEINSKEPRILKTVHGAGYRFDG